MPDNCRQIQDLLDQLRSFQKELTDFLAAAEPVQAGRQENQEKLAEFWQKYEQAKAAHRELREMVWPEIIDTLKLQEQYDQQFQMLVSSGLIETLPDGSVGYTGIDGQPYQFPEFDQIVKRVRSKRELLTLKAGQGFRKLILVPFGLPLKKMIFQLIDNLKDEQEIVDAQGEIIPVKSDNPVDVMPFYYHYNKISDAEPILMDEADRNGSLVYFQDKIEEENNQARTKPELMADQAWQILLVEDLPDLPAAGEEQTVGQPGQERTQLPAGQTAEFYLKKIFEDKSYQQEQGLTPESWIVLALTYLYQQSHRALDCWNRQGKSCLLIGSFFKKDKNNSNSGGVSKACWVAAGTAEFPFSQIDIRCFVTDKPDPNASCRTAVAI